MVGGSGQGCFNLPPMPSVRLYTHRTSDAVIPVNSLWCCLLVPYGVVPCAAPSLNSALYDSFCQSVVVRSLAIEFGFALSARVLWREVWP